MIPRCHKSYKDTHIFVFSVIYLHGMHYLAKVERHQTFVYLFVLDPWPPILIPPVLEHITWINVWLISVHAQLLLSIPQAKRRFWQQIRDNLNKVANSIDINDLDVPSLSLDLEPLKSWLNTFQSLSPEEKHALFPEQNSPDLQDQKLLKTRIMCPVSRYDLMDCFLRHTTDRHRMQLKSF